MLMIKRAPAFVAKELCEGIIDYKEDYIVFSAFDFTGTKGFSVAKIEGENIEVIYVEGEDLSVIDGAVRTIIAYGEDSGCKTYCINVNKNTVDKLLKLEFEVNKTKSIKELFSTCKSCK